MLRRHLPDRNRTACAIAAIAVLTAVTALTGCGDDGAGDRPSSGSEPFVVPTLPSAGDAAGADAAVSSRADVLRAAEAAVAAVGGAAIRTSVDLMGYVVQVRQDDDTFTTVQLDIGFGVVFVEDAEGGRRADELADTVDLRRAADIALELALDEEIGSAGDGIVVGAELEPGEYDIDIQYPDGRVLEVRLDDTMFALTGTRIRGG